MVGQLHARVGLLIGILGIGPWAAGAQTTDVPQLSLTEVVVVDPEANDGVPFGRIAALAVSDDSDLFVLDAFSRSVTRFDPEGRSIGTFGQHGEGPGELEMPEALFWGPNGNLWVDDIALGRATAFTPSGALVVTRRVRGPRMFEPPQIGFAENGRIRFVGLDFTGGSLELPNVSWVELEVADDALAMARQADMAFVEWPEIFEASAPGVALIVPVPFAPQPMFRVDPVGRVWYAEAAAGRVHRWSPGSGIELTLARDVESVPVTAEDIEAELDGNPDLGEIRQLGGDAAVEELRSLIPPTKPVVESFFFDDAGRVWVMRAADFGEPTRPVDVYGPTGELVAEARLDLVPWPMPRVRDGRLAGVRRDALGREVVVVYQVEGGAANR